MLWRWSTTAQVTAALMIALFFVVLAHSTPRVELRPWAQAWLANLGALGVTVVFWVTQPESELIRILLRGSYLYLKLVFLLLMLVGALGFCSRWRPRLPLRRLLLGAALFAAAAQLVTRDIPSLGLTTTALITAAMLAGAALLLRERPPGWEWLAGGFLVRAAAAFAGSVAYAGQAFALPWADTLLMKTFLAAHSSFDTAGEWMIALGCVLMFYRSIQQELAQSNAELVSTHATLQELVDRDALTGLANRRTLPPVLDHARVGGATILFFDLNDFKAINDGWGHHVGDDCLKRFASVLRESFRPGDHIVRYAGDEFLVIAPGMPPEALGERIDAARKKLLDAGNYGPRIHFAVGLAWLPPGGDPDATLRAADEAMYREKAA